MTVREICDRASAGQDIDVGDLTPLDVANIMIKLRKRIREGGEICSRLSEEHSAAKRRHNTAVAAAYLTAEGAAETRKQIAVRDTADELETVDIAAARVKRATMLREDLKDELTMWQAINKNVMQAWQVTGGEL